MVLRNSSLVLFLLAVAGSFILAMPSVQAESHAVRKFTVTHSDCPVKVYNPKKGAWTNVKKKLKVGQKVYGRISAKASNIVVFKRNPRHRIIYAAKLSCTFGKGTDVSRSDVDVSDLETVKLRPPPRISEQKQAESEPTPDGSQDVEIDIPSKHHLYLSVGIFSWQEKLTLTMPSGNSFEVIEDSLGTCWGGGWSYQMKWVEPGIHGCAMHAFSEAGLRGGQTADGAEYRVKNATVFGAQIGPTFLFRPFSGSVGIGINIPVIIRVGNWPDGAATGGAHLSGKFNVFPAPMLEARLERSRFLISQKIGLYRSMKAIIWVLQGSYSL